MPLICLVINVCPDYSATRDMIRDWGEEKESPGWLTVWVIQENMQPCNCSLQNRAESPRNIGISHCTHAMIQRYCLLYWSYVHPAVYGPFDLRNQKAADAAHMASKPWVAWLPVIVLKHLPCISSFTEKSTWSHIHSRIYLSPENTLALTTFPLKTGYTLKKADYVCNIPRCEVLPPLSKVCHFEIKEQQLSMTTKQVEAKQTLSKTALLTHVVWMKLQPTEKKRIYMCVCVYHIYKDWEIKTEHGNWYLSLNPPYQEKRVVFLLPLN